MEILNHADTRSRQGKDDEEEGGNGKGEESATRTGMRRRRHCRRDGGSSCSLAMMLLLLLALGVECVACGRDKGSKLGARRQQGKACGGVGHVWVV